MAGQNKEGAPGEGRSTGNGNTAAGDLAEGKLLRVSDIDPFSPDHEADPTLARVPLVKILGETQVQVFDQRAHGSPIPGLLARDERIARGRPHVRLYVSEFGSYGSCAPNLGAMTGRREQRQIEVAEVCAPCPIITICYARRAQDLLDAVEGQPPETHQQIMTDVMGNDVRAGMIPHNFVTSVVRDKAGARRAIHDVAEVQRVQDPIHQRLAGI